MQKVRDDLTASQIADLDKLAGLLAEQALSIRPKATWVENALKNPFFGAAFKKARTGAGIARAFEAGSLTRNAAVNAAVAGGIVIIATERPDTGAKGRSLDKLDLRGLRRLQKELGPTDAIWALYACPLLQSPKVVETAATDAIAALCTQQPLECPEPSREPNNSPVSVSDSDRPGSAVVDAQLPSRITALEQRVRELLDARRKDTPRERDAALKTQPAFTKLKGVVEGYGSRLKALENTTSSALPKHIESSIKPLINEQERYAKKTTKDVQDVTRLVAKVDSAIKTASSKIESHQESHSHLEARIAELESFSSTNPLDTGALVDGIEQRLLAVEQVIGDLRGLFTPMAAPSAPAIAIAPPLPEWEPSDIDDPFIHSNAGTAISGDSASGGAQELQRIRAARLLRKAALVAAGQIDSPDHLIVDGHNVVVEPMKAGGFRDEREAREWLITQMIALADALDLPDVRILFDTPIDTQWPEKVSDRVSVQYCGPDAGKADGRIVETVGEMNPGDSVVVCSSDHAHVWREIKLLASEGHNARCVERFDVFSLMRAIERYLAAYEVLSVETRMDLVREELEEVAEAALPLKGSALTDPKPSEENPVARIEWYTRMLALDPRQPTLYIGRAKSHHRNGDRIRALSDLEAATAIDPNAVGLKRAYETIGSLQQGSHYVSPSVVPFARIQAWEAAVAAGDLDLASSELDAAEADGARHPYLTLARSADALAKADSAAALELLSRFDLDPYAGPNMRTQAGILRLLAHAQGLGRVPEPQDLEDVVKAAGGSEFSVHRGSLRLYLLPLKEISDVLRASVELVFSELGRQIPGGTARTTAAGGSYMETDRELLKKAGTALGNGHLEEAESVYSQIELQGVARHHAYMNHALVDLASGRIGSAESWITLYEGTAITPMMNLQAIALRQLAHALDGDAVDIESIASSRGDVDVFQAHLSPIWYLARCLRRGGASSDVERVLRAAGF